MSRTRRAPRLYLGTALVALTALTACAKPYPNFGGLVADGRDMGSVVFPNADVKLFITAAIDTRAKRRFLELQQRGIQQSLEQIKSNLLKRDQIDSTRSDSPLTQTADAFLIDNTLLNREQQKQVALNIIKSKTNN